MGRRLDARGPQRGDKPLGGRWRGQSGLSALAPRPSPPHGHARTSTPVAAVHSTHRARLPSPGGGWGAGPRASSDHDRSATSDSRAWGCHGRGPLALGPCPDTGLSSSRQRGADEQRPDWGDGPRADGYAVTAGDSPSHAHKRSHLQ